MKFGSCAFLYLALEISQIDAASFAFSSSSSPPTRSPSSSKRRWGRSSLPTGCCTFRHLSTVATTDRTILPASSDSSSRRRNGQDQNKTNYAQLLNELSNQRTREAAQKAEDMLQDLERMVDSGLNVVHYASVINSWANIGDASRAEAVIDRMLTRSDVVGSDTQDDGDAKVVFPNAHCFSGVMKAIINSSSSYDGRDAELKSHSISKRCELLMNKMTKMYSMDPKKNKNMRPNTVVYNTLLNAYSEEITSLFLKQRMKKGKNLYANVLPHQNNIGRKRDNEYKVLVDKAVSLLQTMEESFDNGNNQLNDDTDYRSIPLPDVYSYCTVISMLAKCEDLKSAALAESYLSKVTKEYDTPIYNAVISAWASTGTLEGAERANELLKKLEDAMEVKIKNLTSGKMLPRDYGPNAVTYHTVISAWVKTCSVGDDGRSAQKAEEILDRMVEKLRSSIFSYTEKQYRFQPNVIAYSSTIDCWSKSGSEEASEHAHRLLLQMEELNIKPNVFSYTSVLTSHARTHSEEGAKRASALLEHMKELYDRTGDRDIKPNVVSYFAVIDSWARSNSADAGVEAENLLLEMEDLYRKGKGGRPDVRVYARVIAAHTKSNQKDKHEKAIELLKRMEAFGLTGDENSALAKPNVVVYNTLIGAYAKNGNAKRAFDILNRLDQFNSRVNNEDDKIIADEHSLNSVIYALSNSNMKGKARKALKMLERLEHSHIDGNWRIRPSSRSYNMVINTCSNSFKTDKKERSQALAIAAEVYSRLRASNSVEVDRYTYIAMLKACGKLLPTSSDERRKLVEGIFRDCCNDGLVDDIILSNFLIAAPKDLSRSILGKHKPKPTAKVLPQAWTHQTLHT